MWKIVMRSLINKTALKVLSSLYPTQKPTLFFGESALANITKLIVNTGVSKPLIIVDSFILNSGKIESSIRFFQAHNCKVTIFDEIAPNPTLDLVEKCINLASINECDSILVIGGGSAIDISKIVAASLTNGQDGKKLVGLMKVKNTPLPLYAVPTTSGTGSEVTPAAVISEPVSHKKMFYIDPKYVPLAAGLDPKLISSLPPAMTAATGMDALTHAIEAYTSRAQFADTQRDALTAIKLLIKYLPVAYDEGKNLEAREMVALGSFLAGYAFSKSGLGYVHAISHQISAHYNTGHGLANAIILPKIIRFNREACAEKFAEIECALIGSNQGKSKEALTNDFILRIDELSNNLKIPKAISDLREENFTTIALGALAEAKSSYAVPKAMKKSDVINILTLLKDE